MSTSIASLVANIDERLAQLAQEIETLTRSRDALRRSGGNDARAAGAPSSRRPSGRPRKTQRVPGPAPGAASSGRPPRRRAASTRPATRSRRASRPAAAVSAAGLERVLVEHPAGLSARAIGDLAGAGYAATLALLRAMEASGQVRREGSRRSTVWRLVSDDERVAVRAAELERQAASASRPRGARRGGRRARQ